MSLRLGPARGVGDAPVLRRQRAATVELVERLERLKKEDAAGLRVHLLLQSGCAPLTFLLVSTCASRERMWELLTLVALSYGERRAVAAPHPFLVAYHAGVDWKAFLDGHPHSSLNGPTKVV